jgi:pectate lyase
MSEPFAFAPVTTQTSEDAYVSVLKNAGAILPKRDVVDTRIIKEVSTGSCTYGDTYDPKTGVSLAHTGIINSQATVGGWPELKSTAAPADTDHDGMPDHWEMKRGLNPKDAADRNSDLNADGYTNLEKYLNELAGTNR